MIDHFYRAFEERYYAPRSVIKELRRQYLPFVTPLGAIYPDCAIFDIGCGRGEWLELMAEIGFQPFGVDLDAGMLEACRQAGLAAEQGDAVAFLKTLPTDSQAIVSAFHVVEHITFDQLRSVVSEAFRVLKPGGLLIMETPNPENIVVGTRSFYLDPTHERPIPSELLSFLPEYYGFVRTKILRLQESKSIAANVSPSLIEVFGGASPDYAVVAQKAAPEELLQRFDGEFEQEYGLPLATLAARYDATIAAKAEQAAAMAQQAEVAAREAEARAQRVEARAREAEASVTHGLAVAQQAVARAQQAEGRAEKAESRTAEADVKAQRAEARVRQAEVELEQMSLQLDGVLKSRSWRITHPLRVAAGFVFSLRGTASVRSKVKTIFTRGLRHGLGTLGRFPKAKRNAILLASRFPKFERKLRSLLLQGEGRIAEQERITCATTFAHSLLSESSILSRSVSLSHQSPGAIMASLTLAVRASAEAKYLSRHQGQD